MKLIFLLLYFILFAGVSPGVAADVNPAGPPGVISVIKLIATPEKYEDKAVIAVGFLNLEFNDDALYLHREDYERVLAENAVAVIPENPREIRRFNKSCMLIEDIFRSRGDTETEIGSGYIESIKHIARWGGDFDV